MKTVLAVAIALVASGLINYSMFLQKKALDLLPKLKVKLSWGVIRTFITNKPWLVSQTFNITGFILYMLVLSFAPVSIIEPIIASGVVLLAYLAMKNLGEKPRQVDLIAMGVTILGVIFLGISLAEGIPADNLHDPLELWLFTSAIIFLAVFIPVALRSRGPSSEAVGLGISAGLFMGIAAVFSRLLMGNFGGQWYIWLPACVLTYTPGFLVLEAALQRGMAVIVTPPYNGIMEFVPILVGTIALNESFPSSHILTTFRLISFALILVGTVILSKRAEEELPDEGSNLAEIPVQE
jgi:uncharacterized membrane protein